MTLRAAVAALPLVGLSTLGLVAAIGAAGCSGGSKQIRPLPCTSCVSLQIQSFDEKKPGPIEPNAELVSGTTFSLKVQTDLPLYLQVGRRTAQGVEPMLPPPGQDPQQAQPGVPLLLPPGDGRILLNDQTGDEVVYVLGSLRRLSPEETAQAMRRPAASIDLIPAAGGSRGVDETNSRNRGFDRNTMTLFGKVQADGAVLLVFPFRHN